MLHQLLSLLFLVVGWVLLPLWFEWTLPMIEVMAATRAAVKLGSAVMAAVAEPIASLNEGVCIWLLDAKGGSSIPWELWRPTYFDWFWRAWPKTCGADMKCGKLEENMLNWPCTALWNCEALWGWVRSNVTVGNGAEAESVAKLGELESAVLASMFEFISASVLGIDPESSIDAAADV